MGRKWWTKFSLVFVLILFSVIYLLPTFCNLQSLPSWLQKILPKGQLQLGLDLQGGLHIVMGIDPKEVLRQHSDLLVEQLRDDLAPQVSDSLEVARVKDSSNILVKYGPQDDLKKIRKIIRNYGSYNYQVFEFLRQGENEILLGLGSQEQRYLTKRAVDQSIEAIRNRIDEFGVAEPSIQSEGADRIVVQLPGIQDVERAKDLIGRTAKLEFKIVDTSQSPENLQALVAKLEKEKGIRYQAGIGQKFSDYFTTINQAAERDLPKESELAFQRVVNDRTGSVTWVPYLLKRKVDVTGDLIRDARWNRSQDTNEPIVEMTFTAQGAKRFAKLTEDNVGQLLAIVLDGMVHSAPRIDEKIPSGRARISFGIGADPNQTLQDAQDTALVLRAGALPTTIELLEERTVGPSLGADSVREGKKAVLIGLLCVVIFMILYYKWAGVIANFALCLNIPFILAILAMFGATLTLPGLAGIVLTIGMAVDANGLIFERIREEIRLNKSAKAAIETGFSKAWSTILDANLTTLIAALALLSEGTGPVKGFAITLSIGIICSMFTAVFVTRLCFEYLLTKLKMTKVSI